MKAFDLLDWLAAATNAHRLDELVDCFAPDYVNVTPAHPARSFHGQEQVRANWVQILTGVPDLQAQVLDRAVDGTTVWSEWEMSGTRRDGQPHHMRGVVIFTVRDGRAATGRFYLEPVDTRADDVNTAIQATVGTGP